MSKKEAVKVKYVLRCIVRDGMFSSEALITVCDSARSLHSFFVERCHVVGDNAISIEPPERYGVLYVVRIPTPEPGRYLCVNESEIIRA